MDTIDVKSQQMISIRGPGVSLTFNVTEGRFRLVSLGRQGKPLVTKHDAKSAKVDVDCPEAPFAVCVKGSRFTGIYGVEDFRLTSLRHEESRVEAELAHDMLPMTMLLIAEAEGHVVKWLGQAAWLGLEAIDADIYYPLLNKLTFSSGEPGRALFPHISGSAIGPLGSVNYFNCYSGSLASPCFITEDGREGIAWLDDNRHDLAADPGACVRRSYLVGGSFGQFATEDMSIGQAYEVSDAAADVTNPDTASGERVSFAAVRHTRRFAASSSYGLSNEGDIVEGPVDITYSRSGRSADYADLGPIRLYAYHGGWKQGAMWLREQRAIIPIRKASSEWFKRASFLSEDMGDRLVQAGQTFYDLHRVLADKRRLGSDLFHMPAFHDGEKLNSSRNWLNRGDYVLQAQNLGGLEAARRGVAAVHRQGGRVLYYVEGLIMWKQSRIGLARGKEWAMMKEDGRYVEHYTDFWHLNPAHPEYQAWLSETCAEIVRQTDIDGFFIDSSCATDNHRNFNPSHHANPDVWNWGLRNLLRSVREALDRTKPEAVIIVEGCSDLAAEFVDGFLAHSHDWTQGRHEVPFVRFLHPDLAIFESWGSAASYAPPERNLLWNAVHGSRIYAHEPEKDRMAPHSFATRAYYDSYPELTSAHHAAQDVVTSEERVISVLFDSLPFILTVANLSDEASTVSLTIPVAAGMLFDRVSGEVVAVVDGCANMSLGPWGFSVYEIRR